MKLLVSSDTILPLFLLWSHIQWSRSLLSDEFVVAPLPWVKLQMERLAMVTHSTRQGLVRSIISERSGLPEVGQALSE